MPPFRAPTALGRVYGPPGHWPKFYSGTPPKNPRSRRGANVVAYHLNGTATILSSRYGSGKYRALVEGLSNVRPIREPTLWQQVLFDLMDFLKRTVTPAVGYTTLEVRVFTELLHKLKAGADQKLDSEIHRATISGPFLPAHYPTTLTKDILKDVLLREGCTSPRRTGEAAVLPD
jgi:hypothetical protein